MSPERQRTAIAEACGWKWLHHPDVLEATKTYTLPDKWVMNPSGELVFPHDAPDYLSDLNAMHEAEKILTEQQEHTYGAELHRLCLNKGRHMCYEAIRATADQRAKAFLRAIEKWEE